MSQNGDPCEPLAALRRCLDVYGRLLELAREQERILAEGRIADLPPLLLRKAELVEQARAPLERVSAVPERARASDAFRRGLEELRVLMARLVEIEERCARAAPTPGGPPKARAAAAYQAQSPSETRPTPGRPPGGSR